MYYVFGVCDSGSLIYQFHSSDMFDCIAYIEQHKDDTKFIRLQLYEAVNEFDETFAEMAQFFEMESNNE